MKRLILSIAICACFVCAVFAKFDSFKPGQLWRDTDGHLINAHGGGFLFHEGKYYWFGEHKIEGEAGNLAQVGVHCYSSEDLYNWKDEGIALRVEADPQSEITVGCVLERPKVIYNKKTKKFAMWFHLELKKGEKPDYTSARCALAVSDNIAGPYKYVKSFRPQKGKFPAYGGVYDVKSIEESYSDAELEKRIKDNGHKVLVGRGLAFVRDMRGLGQMARDMTLYVDDDEKGYLICASEENATLQIHELTDDYQDFTGKFSRATPSDWNEAPAVFKKDGKYYMFSSYCTGWAPNPGRVFVAESIYGPWVSLGNPCIGTPEEMRNTFESQSTYVIKVEGKKDAFIFVSDRWRPKNAIDGRYLFLPVEFDGERPVIRWRDEWNLSFFK